MKRIERLMRKNGLEARQKRRFVHTTDSRHQQETKHPKDPTTLMCGRPAPCRPNLYASETPHFFPLTEADRD